MGRKMKRQSNTTVHRRKQGDARDKLGNMVNGLLRSVRDDPRDGAKDWPPAPARELANECHPSYAQEARSNAPNRPLQRYCVCGSVARLVSNSLAVGQRVERPHDGLAW